MWNRRSSRAPDPLDAQAALVLQKLVYCSDRPQSAAGDSCAVMMTCIAPNSESIKASITLHVMMTPVTSSVRKQALNCACVFLLQWHVLLWYAHGTLGQTTCSSTPMATSNSPIMECAKRVSVLVIPHQPFVVLPTISPLKFYAVKTIVSGNKLLAVSRPAQLYLIVWFCRQRGLVGTWSIVV